jgi:hypothetical protein
MVLRRFYERIFGHKISGFTSENANFDSKSTAWNADVITENDPFLYKILKIKNKP